MKDTNSPWPHLAVRTETWEAVPGAHRALLAVTWKDEARVLALSLDPVSLIWTYGIIVVPERQAGACRDALAAACVERGAYPGKPGALLPMGLLQGYPNRLAQRAIFISRLDVSGADIAPVNPDQHLNRLNRRQGPQRRDLPGCPRDDDRAMDIRYGLSPSPTDSLDDFSLFQRKDVQADLTLPPSPTAVAFRRVTVPDRSESFELRQAQGRQSMEEMSRILGAWSREVSSLLRPVALSFLHERHWTPDAYAHFMRDGDIGTWRRQAASLYPSLAKVQMHEPEVSTAIDAGRPFEPFLAAALGRWIETRLTRGVPQAALRRMRTFPTGHDMDVLSEVASSLATLPVSWLPSTTGEWESFANNVPNLHRVAAALGLDSVAMMRDTDQKGTSFVASTHPIGFDGAVDMARRLADTLLAALGLVPTDPGTLRIAGRLLYEGKSLRSILWIESQWHARLVRFEGTLPVGKDLVSWPALFEPFSACEGMALITCLTLPSELAAEGSSKPDRHGVPGLDHCVAGYGRTCHDGSSYVASVRSVGPEGTRRLSTLELGFDWDSGQSWIEQHKGRSNGTPPDLARQAVQELLDAIPKGRIRVNPEAGPGRDRGEYLDGCDWTDPALAEAAYEAWKPFLLRHRPSTLDGLRKRIAAMAAEG